MNVSKKSIPLSLPQYLEKSNELLKAMKAKVADPTAHNYGSDLAYLLFAVGVSDACIKEMESALAGDRFWNEESHSEG